MSLQDANFNGKYFSSLMSMRFLLRRDVVAGGFKGNATLLRTLQD
jgi:hypothetical protein